MDKNRKINRLTNRQRKRVISAMKQISVKNREALASLLTRQLGFNVSVCNIDYVRAKKAKKRVASPKLLKWARSKQNLEGLKKARAVWRRKRETRPVVVPVLPSAASIADALQKRIHPASQELIRRIEILEERLNAIYAALNL